MSIQAKRAARIHKTNLQRAAWKAGRWFKYNYLKLFRAKEGATKVAAGFSIGLAVEMFTLPTFGLAFLLIFPLVFLFRSSLAGALIGFVFGKVIYIPVAFLNAKVGSYVVPRQFHFRIPFLPYWFDKMLYMNMKLIVGGMINGAILGMIAYFPLKWVLQFYTKKRTEKRRHRKEQLVMKKSNR